MRTISAAIDIDAPPERVWEVLVDFSAYPEWNPFMREVRGRAEVGARLRVRMRRKGGRWLSFAARITVADPPRELAWQGVGLRGHWLGLVRGERRIRIEPRPGGAARVEMRTTFTGLLSTAMGWLDAYLPSFEAMEEALKERAERPAQGGSGPERLE
jgi:hypothetical protein